MVNGNLPDGWTWATVEEVGLVASGQTPKGLENLSREGEIPFYKVSDMNRAGNETQMHDSAIYLNEKEIKQLKIRTFDAGTVIFPKRGGAIATNKKRILSKPSAVDLNIMGVTPQKVSSKYFYYWLSSIDLATLSDGSNVPQINHKDISPLSIPLAPLPEQERIVAKIEELFTQLEAGTSALERVQVGLRRYKASVLKNAFEGKLVPQQESGESVAELLERVIGEDYEKKIEPSALSKVPYVPSGWVYGKLENLIYIAGRIGWRGLKADEYTDDGPMFLSVYNLNMGDHVDFTDTYHISPERYDESPEIMLRENDILLAKDGAGIGKIGIVKGLPGLATVNSSLLVIRVSEIFIPEFLFYFLKGPQMQDVVRARITGSATPHLFQRDIKQFTLLIPPLEEQRRIVAEVERRLSVAREVESVVEKALARSARLRQAVLKSAFEGKLT